MQEVKRKIVVKVGYFDFEFSDLIAANAFAGVAKSHLAKGDCGKRVSLTVEYGFTEKENEEEQDDQNTD